MVSKEEILKRILEYNAPNGRTVKALGNVFGKEYPAGTNLVVEFAKEFIGLPYGDDGLRLDKKADCSQFWENVFYYWFGARISSYTESQWKNKNGKKVTPESITPLCLIYYDFGKPGRMVTHVAGYIGNGKIAHTRSRLKPFMLGGVSYGKDDIAGIVDFLTEEQRASVIVQGEPVYSDRPRLKKGSTGDAVKELQTLLNLSGAKIEEDGIFGKKTLAAVKAWQKKKGLETDGIAGPGTWASLLS